MDLIARDRAYVWHPYTQMLTAPDAVPIVRGEGAKLYCADGRVLIDAVSSWWVTVHGHAERSIAEAIARQALELEQVMFAGFTHPQAVRLAERLVGLLGRRLGAGAGEMGADVGQAGALGIGGAADVLGIGGATDVRRLSRVFYSDDGSTAVEVALKMAWQYWQNLGSPRKRVLALEHGYHGDTFGAMSVSGRSVFTQAFGPLLFEVTHVPSPGEVPAEVAVAALEGQLLQEDAVALILEPLVQGAGGMRMYAPETLDALVGACRRHGVPVIFDEVMTGFYRTGRMFAADHCALGPDIVCLSKGLSGGFLPLAATVCTDAIYDAFLGEERAKMLFHGHSFTANPLGCAAANASLDLFETAETQGRIAGLCRAQEEFAERLRGVAEELGVRNVRCLGTIVAFDLVAEGASGYLNTIGLRVREEMLVRGVILRPLGDVVYVMPPYGISEEELAGVYVGLEEVLRGEIFGK